MSWVLISRVGDLFLKCDPHTGYDVHPASDSCHEWQDAAAAACYRWWSVGEWTIALFVYDEGIFRYTAFRRLSRTICSVDDLFSTNTRVRDAGEVTARRPETYYNDTTMRHPLVGLSTIDCSLGVCLYSPERLLCKYLDSSSLRIAPRQSYICIQRSTPNTTLSLIV